MGACYRRHNWSCVGNSISTIASDVSAAAPKNRAIQRIVGVVAKVGHTVTLGVSAVQTYRQMDRAMHAIEHARTPAQVRSSLRLLTQALATIHPEIDSLNSIVGAKFAKAMHGFEHGVEVGVRYGTQIANEISVYGVNIYNEVKQLPSEWRHHHYVQFAHTLEAITHNLMGAFSRYHVMSGVVSGLRRVDRVLTTGLRIASICDAGARQLDDALSGSWRVDSVQSLHNDFAKLGQISHVIQTIAGELRTTNPRVATEVNRVAGFFTTQTHISSVTNDIIVMGTDITSDFMSARTCWRHKNYSCVGQRLGTAIQQIKTTLPATSWVKQIVQILAKTQRGFIVVNDSVRTYRQFHTILLDWQTARAATTGATTRRDYRKLIRDIAAALRSIMTNLLQVDPRAAHKLAALIDELEKPINIQIRRVANAAGHLERRVELITGKDYAIYGNINDLITCLDQSGVECLVRAIEHLMKITKTPHHSN